MRRARSRGAWNPGGSPLERAFRRAGMGGKTILDLSRKSRRDAVRPSCYCANMWYSVEILVPALRQGLAVDFSGSEITVLESSPPISHRGTKVTVPIGV